MSETIVFCVPGKTFSINFMRSWTDTIIECRKRDINFLVSWAIGANVYQVRNYCLNGNPGLGPTQKPFQGQIKYDYLMWFDSDQVWRVKDFLTMLDTMRKNTGIRMLTGVYPMVAEGKANLTTICKLTKGEHGLITNQLLTVDEVNGLAPLAKVDASGLGFCMMRSGVIETLEYPWFRPVMITDERSGKDVYFLSEDVSLFINLKEKNIDLICATKIRIGHEKDKIYYVK